MISRSKPHVGEIWQTQTHPKSLLHFSVEAAYFQSWHMMGKDGIGLKLRPGRSFDVAGSQEPCPTKQTRRAEGMSRIPRRKCWRPWVSCSLLSQEWSGFVAKCLGSPAMVLLWIPMHGTQSRSLDASSPCGSRFLASCAIAPPWQPYFSCISEMLKSKRWGVCVLMQPFPLSLKEGPVQPPQGAVLQNLRKVLYITVEKTVTKPRGKKSIVCLLSRGL